MWDDTDKIKAKYCTCKSKIFFFFFSAQFVQSWTVWGSKSKPLVINSDPLQGQPSVNKLHLGSRLLLIFDDLSCVPRKAKYVVKIQFVKWTLMTQAETSTLGFFLCYITVLLTAARPRKPELCGEGTGSFPYPSTDDFFYGRLLS